MKTITTLMAIGSLALAACGGSSSSSDTGTAVAAKPASYGSSNSAKTTPASNTSGRSGPIQVAMHDNFFGSKVITGKPGSTVKVALKNDGKNEHNFKVVGEKADADVKPGQSATVSVVIPKSGTAQFFCEYHKGLGMVGTVKAS